MAVITLLYNAPSTSYAAPWNDYLFQTSDPNLFNLVLGQEVTNITYIAAPPTEAGTGVGVILSFLYSIGANLYLTNVAGSTLTGFIIIDSNGTLLIPDNGSGGGRGYVTFGDTVLTADQKNEECFNKLVWDKQCEFAKKTSKYLNKILFGYIDSCSLDCLKDDRRVLEILNDYDTRDIEGDTVLYNTLTYTQIKKLLDS